jgi:hypothetical protein
MRGVELRFASGLKSVVVLGRLFEVGLDDVTPLVDLHRKDRQMIATISKLVHRLPKGLVHLPHLAGEDLRKAESAGSLMRSGEQVVDHSLDVNKAGIVLQPGGRSDVLCELIEK